MYRTSSLLFSVADAFRSSGRSSVNGPNRSLPATSTLVAGLALLVFITLSVLSQAQTGGSGSIQGTVTDPSGASIAGASVIATNAATGERTEAVATESGFFVLPLLHPGQYIVTVTAPGFRPLRQEHVVVDALATVVLSPRLEIGTIGESVTVTTEPTMLKTDDKLGSSMQNNIYDALPLAMNQSARDPSAFAGLASGVSGYSVQAAGPSTGSFNGGQPYQNETYFEGLPMTSAGTESDTRNLAFGISVDAVEQFQVATSGSEATYEGQGMSNYIVKSGTNRFHGDVFEYFRNTVFDAKGYFPPKDPVTNKVYTPPEHQNEFGVSIGGPIMKDKLFFFANYDGYRLATIIPPAFQTIPTAAMRNGDFSAFSVQIFDPTTCLNTNASGQCTQRAQFPGNIIPANRISAVAKSFQSYLPATTVAGLSNNYLATLPNKVNNDSVTTKVDYNVTNKHHLYAVFSKGKYANPIVGSLAVPVATSANITSNSALPVPYADGRGVTEYATLGQVHETYTINPTVVNDLGYSVNRLFIPLTSNTASGNYPSKAGLTGLPPGIASTGFPDISFNSANLPIMSWDGTNSHAFNEAQTSYTVQDNLMWTRGKHRFTAGFQWQALQDNLNSPLTGTQAAFTFAQNETADFIHAGNPNAGAIDSATGLAYASYLLGAVDSSTVTQNAVAETGGRYKTYATYFQDNIQVNPRLTLNLGLRYDIWGTFTEVQDRMTFFNPNLPNPVAGNILGALRFAGKGAVNCNCRTPVSTYYRNLGPRVGLAYRIGEKTVLRSFYGIFYAHAGGVGGRVNGRQGLSQIGFNNNGSLNSTVTGQPAYYWDNGYPGNPINPPFFNPSYGIGFISKTAPGAAPIGAGPGTAQTLVYGDPNKGGQPPQYQDWSLSIQHSFTPNMVLTLAYSASVGHRLPGAGVAGQFTNQIPAQYLPLKTLLTTTLTPASLTSAQNILTPLGVTIPWASAGAPFPFFTGTIGQALKPYPQYSGLSDPWLDIGNSSYHALQTSLNRRISNGLTFMVNYTWSKEIDDLLANVRYPGANSLERSLGAIDRPHVASATAVYQLPFGAGHRWNTEDRVLRGVISNWQLSGIFQYSSGVPLSITGSCTGGGIIDSTCFPNLTPGFTGSVWQNGTPGKNGMDVRQTHFLNSAAFIDLGSNHALYDFTYGNAPRTAPYGLRAPHNANVDVSVRREIPIREAVKLSIQVDAFNVNNAVHFAAPNTSLSSASFGTFSATANLPRKLQFSARVTF